MSRKKGKSKSYQSLKAPPTHKQKEWTEASMVGALNEVKKGKQDSLHVWSTLKDRVTGRVRHGTNPGPSPYLNKEEE